MGYQLLTSSNSKARSIVNETLNRGSKAESWAAKSFAPNTSITSPLGLVENPDPLTLFKPALTRLINSSLRLSLVNDCLKIICLNLFDGRSLKVRCLWTKAGNDFVFGLSCIQQQPRCKAIGTTDFGQMKSLQYFRNIDMITTALAWLYSKNNSKLAGERRLTEGLSAMSGPLLVWKRCIDPCTVRSPMAKTKLIHKRTYCRRNLTPTHHPNTLSRWCGTHSQKFSTFGKFCFWTRRTLDVIRVHFFVQILSQAILLLTQMFGLFTTRLSRRRKMSWWKSLRPTKITEAGLQVRHTYHARRRRAGPQCITLPLILLTSSILASPTNALTPGSVEPCRRTVTHFVLTIVGVVMDNLPISLVAAIAALIVTWTVLESARPANTTARQTFQHLDSALVFSGLASTTLLLMYAHCRHLALTYRREREARGAVPSRRHWTSLKSQGMYLLRVITTFTLECLALLGKERDNFTAHTAVIWLPVLWSSSALINVAWGRGDAPFDVELGGADN